MSGSRDDGYGGPFKIGSDGIGDGDDEAGSFIGDHQAGSARNTVLGCIRERLLDDAVGGEIAHRIELLDLSTDRGVDFAILIRQCADKVVDLGEAGQRRLRFLVVRRSQEAKDRRQVGEGGPGRFSHVTERCGRNLDLG